MTFRTTVAVLERVALMNRVGNPTLCFYLRDTVVPRRITVTYLDVRDHMAGSISNPYGQELPARRRQLSQWFAIPEKTLRILNTRELNKVLRNKRFEVQFVEMHGWRRVDRIAVMEPPKKLRKGPSMNFVEDLAVMSSEVLAVESAEKAPRLTAIKALISKGFLAIFKKAD